MTDQTIPAGLTRDEAQAVREWAEQALAVEVQDETVVHAARVLLAVLPKRPTLADMCEEERRACRWMQADTEQLGRVVILMPNASVGRALMLDWEANVVYAARDEVTPRPDLPRLEWPDADQDGEEATKVDYVSVAGGRTAYGPWTVARLRKKPDTTPALPDGWRLADHKDHGRVIVTNPTPNRDGYVYVVLPVDDPMGYDWHFCDPDDLTYIGKEADQ